MLNIKTPVKYINEPGILAKAGPHIAVYGHRAVIVGSKTSLKVAKDTLITSLEQSSVSADIYLFEGYPSERVISEIQRKAADFHADVLVALGGGKVMDAVKAAGDRSALPVVAVPTIAATCAAWAAVSIIYSDEGAFTDSALNTRSPRLILADTDIIAVAPERYLKAGIIDTLAKYYETLPNLPYVADSLNFRLVLNTAKIAFDSLTGNIDRLLNDLRENKVTQEVSDAVDAILYFAGLVGSIADGFYGGFAHTFYNAVTSIPGTRDRLHGEKVAFGLLAQFVLEGKTGAELAPTLSLFHKLEQPLTLAQIGLTEIDSATLDRLVSQMTGILPYVRFLSGVTASDLKAAILKADIIGHQFLEASAENGFESKKGA